MSFLCSDSIRRKDSLSLLVIKRETAGANTRLKNARFFEEPKKWAPTPTTAQTPRALPLKYLNSLSLSKKNQSTQFQVPPTPHSTRLLPLSLAIHLHPAHAEMSGLRINVLFNGKWVESGKNWKYITDTMGRAMYLSRDCTFEQLLDRCYDLLHLDRAAYKITMTFKFTDMIDAGRTQICTNEDVLLFYEENSDSHRRRTPLCLLIEPVVIEPERNSNVDALHSFEESSHAPEELCFSQPENVIPENPFGMHPSPNVVESGFGYKHCSNVLKASLDTQSNPKVSDPPANHEPCKTSFSSAHAVERDGTPPHHDLYRQDNNNVENAIPLAVRHSVCRSANASVGPSMSSRPSCMNFNGDVEVAELHVNKKELYNHISLLAIKRKFQFKVAKSTRNLLGLRCADKTCKWRVNAKKLENSNYFRVSKYISIHSCAQNFHARNHLQATTQVVKDCIVSKYVGDKRKYKPKDIIEDFRREYGVNISYSKAHRARQKAIESLQGWLEESYNVLPKYCAMLELKNPGTVTHIETDDDDHFKYFFMAIGACVGVFGSCMRPVIAIDSISLTSKYHGTLFIATCKDGNNQLYPIAFGIGDSENNASWEWFFWKLQGVVGEVGDLVFISKQNPCIEKAVREVCPNALHRTCINYVGQILKNRFKKKDLVPLFHMAAKAYCESDFSNLMAEICKCDAGAKEYLTEVGLEKWACAYFDGTCYNIMTTNIDECLSVVQKDARALPVTKLVEHLRKLLQCWFSERRTAVSEMGTELTAWADAEFCKRNEKSLGYSVTYTNFHEITVYDGDGYVVVNLQDKTCTCQEFQLIQLPCAHAFTAARHCNVSPYSLSSHYYMTRTLISAYAESICPVGYQCEWKVEEKIKEKVVKPPKLTRQPVGRPRKECLPSACDKRVLRKCGRCSGWGHNRKTCKELIPLHSTQSTVVGDDDA